MMNNPRRQKATEGRWLNIEEVTLIADLRIMHSKIDELYSVVEKLKRRHSEADMKYSDYDQLQINIRHVDEIYLWFVKIKEKEMGPENSGNIWRPLRRFSLRHLRLRSRHRRIRHASLRTLGICGTQKATFNCSFHSAHSQPRKSMLRKS